VKDISDIPSLRGKIQAMIDRRMLQGSSIMSVERMLLDAAHDIDDARQELRAEISAVGGPLKIAIDAGKTMNLLPSAAAPPLVNSYWNNTPSPHS
jgi:hypothetical protein